MNTTNATVLVTGGYGCIGAETVKWLVRETDCRVVVCSRSVHAARSEAVFGDLDHQQLSFVQADVTDINRMRQVFSQFDFTHVAHLAGLQTPECNSKRELGLQVNLVGTQNLLELSKQLENPIERFVYASSIAVYGPRASYPSGPVRMDSAPAPVNVYGVWKLASEHICRLYSSETGVDTISIRPGVLFGPGRDLGLTSTPTTAMKQIAKGQAFEIPFSNRQDYMYAPDVGAAFGHALLEPFSGYAAFTLPGHCVDTTKVVAAMQAACDELGMSDHFKITIGNDEVPFVCELEYQPFVDAFPNVPQTPLADAVKQSIKFFVDQHAAGLLG